MKNFILFAFHPGALQPCQPREYAMQTDDYQEALNWESALADMGYRVCLSAMSEIRRAA